MPSFFFAVETHLFDSITDFEGWFCFHKFTCRCPHLFR
jgi:hypothetical protein